MRYNWDGDVIHPACVVERKRFAPGGSHPVRTDIREFVSPADDVVLKELLKELVHTKGLPQTKEPGDFDRRASILWDHVARTVTYQGDRKRKGKRDHRDVWLFPSEVLALGRGDCEDASFLLASLLLGSGISPFNVRVVLGHLVDPEGRPLGDHCWPMYKNELGEWCILEATRERAAWRLIRADDLAESGEIAYEPHFCFNNHHLWSVRHERTHYRDIQQYLEGHSERLVNLENPRFPSGGWLSMITGDDSPGHWELTTQVLRVFGFSDDAISIAAEASQDADFYEWHDPEAHAQTGCSLETGATTQSPKQGIQAFVRWIESRKASFLDTREPKPALFWLGYLLHGIQDLDSHQGATNAQHAYESYIRPGKDADCDHDPQNREHAVQDCLAFLDSLLPRHPNLQALKAFQAGFSILPPKLSKTEKETLLGKAGWDLTVKAYLEYKALASKYEAVQASNPRITWDRKAVLARL